MESIKENAPRKTRSFAAKTGRVLVWIIVSFIFIIILLLILIQTTPVQNFVRKKVVSYLENKLKTKVEIGRINVAFPTSISLQNVYFEDQSKDTLLYGGELKLNISMLKLLKSDIQINEISVNNIVAKIKRLPPDSVFNFQYIINAFASNQKSTAKNKDTASRKINIERIVANNTRIIYKDAFTGNDMDISLGHLDTKISTFDPSHLLFNIPTINLKGLRGYYYQVEPSQKSIEKTVAEAAAQPGNYLQLINKEMNLSDINFVYKSGPLNLNSSFVISNLVLHPKTIDLKNSIITLNDATLNNSDIKIEMESKAVVKESPDSILTVAPTPPFKIISGEITINKSNLQYDDKSMPHIPKGMDYSHLNLSQLSLNATNLAYSIDTILASVKSGSFKESSGFILNNLATDFAMDPTGVSFQDLLIETPGSEIRNSAAITYPSLAAILKNPGLTGLDIDLQNSKISVKDLLTFVPQLNSQTSALSSNSTLYIDTRITGKVNDMNFKKLIVRGLSATDINATGVVKGIPDIKKIYADLIINKFQSTQKDILSFLPKNVLPKNITLPESLAASGKIKGSMNNLYTDVLINTSMGDAKIIGTLANITDQNKGQYDLAVNARNLQLATIMQNPKLGLLTGDFKVKGNGFKPETANATFNGAIANVTLNNYNYKNIKADGSIANKIYKLNAAVHDPNLDAVVAANGKISVKFPGVHFKATIDSIKTFPLHLTSYSVIYHGQIEGDFTNTDPDNLAGNLVVTHSILVNNGERITIDSLEVLADNNNGNHSLTLKSDFLSATIKGQYKLTQLADVFQQSIDPYFVSGTKKNTIKVDPYNFTLNAGATNNAALRAFFPQLKQLKPVNLTGNFSDSGWNVNLKSPYIIYGTYVIDDANFTAGTKNGILAFQTSFKQFKSGTSINVYATALGGTFKNNSLDFTLLIKDQKSVDKYTLSGMLTRPSSNNFSFSLKPANLLLNYNKWNISADNSIQYLNKEITAHNFVISQGTQQLSLNSAGSGNNIPLQIDFKSFRIETLSGFVQSNSLMINGLLNGTATVKNIQAQPTFTTDLTVTDLSIYKDTLGTLSAKVNNNTANTYHANISLNGRGNQVNITGDYLVNPTNSSYNLTADVVSLQMNSIEAFTKGGIKDARGFLYGKIVMNGSLKNPNIDGKINFDNTAFNVSAFNNIFKVDKEAIAIINNKGIEFNSFTIRDTANNALVIDGAVSTTDFLNYSFDLKVKADNFQAINSTKKDNALFYGKMIFSTNLTVKGTPSHPVVDGNLTINNKTDFTIVLPQNQPGVVNREGVVRFVNHNATAEDSLFMMAPYDSLNISPLMGYDVSVNINITKEAVFNMIVDAANGDFLKLKGTGQLTGGVDASGKITLVGSYELDEGSYDLSFNFIKRKFIIEKGSRIVWTGEPTTAQLNVNAVYVANTAPLDLVLGQTTGDPNIYKQKLPFEVHLLMTGELLKPKITFDIILPAEKNYNVSKEIISTVQAKLIQMRLDQGEMNKQVFALLLLNRFVSQNPFDNSSGGLLDANAFAMQSVSSLLSEQLNNLTKGLIAGVDINFDLATTQDYTTGTKQNRTDFNVGVSKRLLSDRLTVSVGSNFELQGPQPTNAQQNNLAGNISINYKLSKDGKYMLRVYRKNDYTGIIEGYVIETGVGFIISVDYNKFKELFTTKEQRRKKREIRKQNNAITKADAVQKANEQTNTPPVKVNEK